MTPFDKYTPSVFAICSPFQALCAIAAIKQFEIEDYKMIALLPRDDVRNMQVESVLHFFDIEYTTISPSNCLETLFYKYRPLVKRNNKFKRLFIGDFRTLMNYSIGCGYVSDYADVVYLDDGLVTVSLLRGRNKELVSSKSLKLIDKYSKRRRLVFFKNFCTIYNDIPNSHYRIEELQLHLLFSGRANSNQSNKNVYIVGTNLKSYCGTLRISEEEFLSTLENVMISLKKEYPEEKIIYIPHGAEKKEYAQQLCLKHSVLFLKPQTTVELELLTSANPPKAIYGFTSTALLTLKKIFPEAKVVNMVFDNIKVDNPFVADLLDSSRYYSQNAIEWLSV